jgi:hypothetical protein
LVAAPNALLTRYFAEWTKNQVDIHLFKTRNSPTLERAVEEATGALQRHVFDAIDVSQPQAASDGTSNRALEIFVLVFAFELFMVLHVIDQDLLPTALRTQH